MRHDLIGRAELSRANPQFRFDGHSKQPVFHDFGQIYTVTDVKLSQNKALSTTSVLRSIMHALKPYGARFTSCEVIQIMRMGITRTCFRPGSLRED
jgi:hypothetical protein